MKWNENQDLKFRLRNVWNDCFDKFLAILLESSQPTVCDDCANQWEKVRQACEHVEPSRRIIIRKFQLCGEVQYKHRYLMQWAWTKKEEKRKGNV